jgi:multidrug efflux pump subunit AcrB
MLTDNAIIVIERIKVGIEDGQDKLKVVRDAVSENQWPLFGATAIGIIAFAAIGLSEDSTGEYCNSLFWVILISLSLSWISSITVTPLLSYLSFRPLGDSTTARRDPYAGVFFQKYRQLLALALHYRWAVVGSAAVLFAASLWGFTKANQSFFPPATRPQFMVDCFLPSATHIRDTEAFATRVEQFVQQQPGVTHVTSFIGGGGMRFLLVYSPEGENRSFVQFLVDVKDHRQIEGLIATIQQHLDEEFPTANAIAKKFLLGPGAGGRIQVRFSGPDPATLRHLADQAIAVLENDRNALCIRSDWREREKVLRPQLFAMPSRRNGITRVEVSEALQAGFEGRTIGFYREPGSARAGNFPQETRLLPIIARPPLAERGDVAFLASMQIWSPVAGRMIPLSQVMSDAEIDWEDPVIHRRNRNSTITVHADPRSGLPSHLFERVRPAIEQIQLPPGYSMQWGGEHEDSSLARAALLKPLPYVFALMVLIVICLFNSLRITLLIWLIMPLALIGITIGLLSTGQAFGFMALLGVLAVGGELIKTQIVVLSKIRTEILAGKSPYQAVLDGGTSKVRPVCMVVLTTLLGSIPLLQDPFFSAMAVCIMFGLTGAAILALFVTPVLYAIFFSIHADGDTREQAPDSRQSVLEYGTRLPTP